MWYNEPKRRGEIDYYVGILILASKQFRSDGDRDFGDVTIERTIVGFVGKAVDAREACVGPIGKGAVGTEGDQCSGGWVRNKDGGDGAAIDIEIVGEQMSGSR